jgi:GNAT superfamily N-acetyltransferase
MYTMDSPTRHPSAAPDPARRPGPPRTLRSRLRRALNEGTRRALAFLPREARFGLYRALIDCDPDPDPRLALAIAETRADLEACFALLHDAYVASGFMAPQPSGLRVTPYHALPTTTTLCAKFDGEVVGTLSLIREGVFGFPLQSAFDLGAVRAREGRIAEVSALAVHPRFRKTGGAVLFPLMKFMYEYCTQYFDTRHLVIAVNPDRIELYEALLLFERLPQPLVAHYDFANGAPAVGATLDLRRARLDYEAVYGRRSERRNLYRYFVQTRLPHIAAPQRPYHVTNDPVMTPALLDHFFNRRSRVFDTLSLRQRVLLHSIYDLPEYRDVLPALPGGRLPAHAAPRRHRRYSLHCPARLRLDGEPDDEAALALTVVEVSLDGFRAISPRPLPLDTWGLASVELGLGVRSMLRVSAVRGARPGAAGVYGFRIEAPDRAWRLCVAALEGGRTHRDLQPAADAGTPTAPDVRIVTA